MDVGFGVVTAVVMKSTTFWDIRPWSPLSVNRRFGGTYRLHHHGRKNKLSKLCLPSAFTLVSCSGYFFRPWSWTRYVPPKRRFTLNGLHGVISQKMLLFFGIMKLSKAEVTDGSEWDGKSYSQSCAVINVIHKKANNEAKKEEVVAYFETLPRNSFGWAARNSR
jgi:hypothetical protein